jgi:hypothetical protein
MARKINSKSPKSSPESKPETAPKKAKRLALRSPKKSETATAPETAPETAPKKAKRLPKPETATATAPKKTDLSDVKAVRVSVPDVEKRVIDKAIVALLVLKQYTDEEIAKAVREEQGDKGSFTSASRVAYVRDKVNNSGWYVRTITTAGCELPIEII